jgi:hypothetical protein
MTPAEPALEHVDAAAWEPSTTGAVEKIGH